MAIYNKIKTGAIIFASKANNFYGATWASTGTGSVQEIIQKSCELDFDTYWLTNLPCNKNESYRKYSPIMVLRSNFLREDIESIARRHNIDTENDFEKYTKFSANIMEQMTLLGHYFHKKFNYRFKFKFKDALMNHFKKPRLSVNEQYRRYIKSQVVYYRTCREDSKNKISADKKKVLIFPQRDHAFNIMNTSLPARRLVMVNDIVPANETAIDQYISTRRPGFYGVRLLNYDPSYQGLFYRHDNRNLVEGIEWLSAPELLALNQYGSYKIEKILLADEVFHFNENDMSAFNIDEDDTYGPVMNLFYDNYWHSAAHGTPSFTINNVILRNPGGDINDPRDKIEHRHYYCYDIYLYGKDRSILIPYVAKLLKYGIDVLGYGNGRIRINTSDLSELDVFKLSLYTGTIPEVLHLDRDILEKAIHNKNILTDIQLCYATNDVDKCFEQEQKLINIIVS